MFQSINGINLEGPIGNKLPEVMILQSNVLCVRSESGDLCHFNGALVILPDGTEEIGIFISDR